MEARKKAIMTFVLLISLITSLYIFTDWFSKTTGYLIGEDPDSEVAKCLTENGAVLYFSDSCPDCEKQKSLFGNSIIKYINITDCTKNPEKCANLRLIPAWYINKSVAYGVKTVYELKILSSC